MSDGLINFSLFQMRRRTSPVRKTVKGRDVSPGHDDDENDKLTVSIRACV